MSNEHKIDLLATYLETVIADIGHPVGMGIAPSRESLTRMAIDVLKISQAEEFCQ